MRELFLRLKLALCAICTMASVLAAGCAESTKEEAKATATQNPIEQVIDKEKITPSPTPTSTPMDASFITPMPTATPIPQTVLSEEEIIARAKEYYQRLKAFDPDFQYDEEKVLDQVEMANGIYKCLDDLSQASQDEVLTKKSFYFNDTIWFLQYYAWAINEKLELMESGKKTSFSKLETFKIYDINLAGVDTFKLIEDSISEFYNCIYDWDLLYSKGLELLKLVEAVCINNCNEWNGIKITPFQSCYPDIRARMIEEIYGALIGARRVEIFYLFDKDGNEIPGRDVIGKKENLNYSTSSMAKKLHAGNSYNDNEITATIIPDIFAIMDTYMAMKEQGIYDAYLAGDTTRKAIIKTLCIEGKANLY